MATDHRARFDELSGQIGGSEALEAADQFLG